MVEIVKLKLPEAEGVISALEEVLAEARAGTVSGLAYAITRPDGNMATNVCWEAGRTAPLLLAGATLLKRRVAEELIAANDAQEGLE